MMEITLYQSKFVLDVCSFGHYRSIINIYFKYKELETLQINIIHGYYKDTHDT